jgi:hypothetical protein
MRSAGHLLIMCHCKWQQQQPSHSADTVRTPLQAVEEPTLCTAATAITAVVGGNVTALPQRPEGPSLGNFSNVLSQPLRCWPNSPLQLHDLKARLRVPFVLLPLCISCASEWLLQQQRLVLSYALLTGPTPVFVTL